MRDESRSRARCSIGSTAERFEVEISDRYERDVLEDAAVGAYIAAIDGERLEPARKLVRSGARRRLQHAAVGARGLAPAVAGARRPT